MNDDLQVSWLETLLDIGGQPAEVQGYRVWDMTAPLNPVELAEVFAPTLTVTLEGIVADPNNPPPVAVSAYNAIGDGARSATVIAGLPSLSVPEAVSGVSAVILPK